MRKGQKVAKQDDALNNPFDVLDDSDKLYVDMAVHGYTHLHIAKKAKREYSTVRNWFARGGRLHDAYKFKLKEHRKEYAAKFKQIDALIKEGAVDAVLKLIEAVKASGTWPGTIMAARDLLSRAGFDPVEKTEGSMTHKTDAEAIALIRGLIDDARPKPTAGTTDAGDSNKTSEKAM